MAKPEKIRRENKRSKRSAETRCTQRERVTRSGSFARVNAFSAKLELDFDEAAFSVAPNATYSIHRQVQRRTSIPLQRLPVTKVR
jgi:hypothetical protein